MRRLRARAPDVIVSTEVSTQSSAPSRPRATAPTRDERDVRLAGDALPIARVLGDALPAGVLAAALEAGALAALPVTAALGGGALRWWVPLAAGAAFGALRQPMLARVRRRVRPRLFARAAAQALERHGAVAEARADQTFWGIAIVEKVLTSSAPAAVGAAAALLVALAIAARTLGFAPIGALAATAIAALGARELLRRRRQSMYDDEIVTRRLAAGWFAAAVRDHGEIRGERARAVYLRELVAACREWSRAEDAREAILRRQWLLVRVVLAVPVALVLAYALGIAPRDLLGAFSQREALAAHWRGLATLLAAAPAVLVLSRALDEIGSARRHFHHARLLAPPPPAPPAAAFPAGDPALTMRELTVRYGDHTALDRVSLALPLQGLTAIVGPNGSGKSTLARVMTGALPPTAGRITLSGEPAARIDPAAIALVPQAPVLVEALSLRDNVRLVAPDAPDDAIRATLAALGLRRPLDQVAEALSSGEQRRLAIARALLKDPRLLVLDEPDAWLDHAGRTALALALRRHAGARAVVLVTHRAELARGADRVIVLAPDHTIEAHGPPDEVATRSPTFARLLDAAADPLAPT